MKMKKLLSLILAVAMVMSMICVPVSAAGEISTDIVLTKDDTGIALDWKVKTGTATFSCASIAFTYDASVLQLVDCNGNPVTIPEGSFGDITATAQLSTHASMSFPNNMYAVKGEGTLVHFSIERGTLTTLSLAELTSLGTCRLAYKAGKSAADVNKNVLRIAKADEAALLNYAVAPFYFADVDMNESTFGGTNDNLDASAVVFGSTFPFAKLNPTYTAPTGLTATYGDKLSTITLTGATGDTAGTWAWVNPTATVGNVGNQTHKAQFTPADTATYKTPAAVDLTVTVSAKSLTDVTVAAIADQEYTGSPIKPALTVKGDGGKTLVEGTDYTVDYANNTNIGDAAVTVKAKAGGNYTFADVNSGFVIRGELTGLALTIVDWTYGETPNDPEVLGLPGSGMVDGYKYKVKGAADSTYTDTVPENVGEYTVKATIIESTYYHATTVTKDFKIKPASIATAAVEAIGDKTYTGSAFEPAPAVTLRGKTLVEGTDYTVDYADNTDAGMATVTITGMGNYTGMTTENFIINRAPHDNETVDKTVLSNTYDQNATTQYTFELSSKIAEGGALASAPAIDGNITINSAVVSGKNVIVVLVPAAKDNLATLTFNVTGCKNYEDYTVTLKLTSADKEDAGVSISTAPTAKTYGDAEFTLTAAKTCADGTNGTWQWTSSNPAALEIVSGNTATATIKVKGASTTAVTITAEYTNDTHYGDADVSITVDPKTLTKADLEYTGTVTKVYDGTTASDLTSVSVKSGALVGTDTLPVTGTAVYNSADVADAEKVTFTPNAITTGNYSLAATETLEIPATITKATLTVTGTAAAEATYGTKLNAIAITGLTASLNGTPVAGSWSFGADTVLDAGNTAAYPATFAPAAGAGNYEVLTKDIVPTINQAAAQQLTTINGTFKYTATSGEKELGMAGMPADAGTLEFVKGTAVVSGSGTFTWNVDADGKLTFTVSGFTAGDTVELPITVKSTNYADSALTVKFTVTEKDPQAELKITSGTEVVYGATLTLTTEGGSGTGTVSYAVTGGNGTATINGDVLTATQAGTVTVVATKAGDNEYNAVDSVPVTITINKAKPTGAPAYTKITTDGMTLADAAIAVGTLTPAGGTIAWDLADTTKVTANTAYAWTYTPADTTNYEVLKGTITPYEAYGSGVKFYMVQFFTNGGSGIQTVRKVKNTVVNLAAYVPTREGYTFEGWYSNSALTNKVTSVTLTRDYKVYAKWTAIEAEAEMNFGDVKLNDWFYNSVQFVFEEGIMNGVSANKFGPEEKANRAMIVTMLHRLAGEPEGGTTSFKDVPADAYYAKAAAWAASNGIVNGYNATTFAPMDYITREQLVTILYRYAKLIGVDVTVSSSIASYADADKVSDYAVTAMQWAVGAGIINGKSADTLDPNGTAIRCEIAAIFMRFAQLTEK